MAKKKKPKSKSKKIVQKIVDGRKTVMTEAVVRVLERAFMDFANVTEACNVAKICTTTYYKHIDKNKEFMYRMTRAQQYPIAMAKKTVARNVKKLDQPEFALKVLQSKCNNEFPNKHQLEHSGAVDTGGEVVQIFIPDNSRDARSGERPPLKKPQEKAEKPVKMIKLKKKKR